MDFYEPFPEDERHDKTVTLLDKKILEMIRKAIYDKNVSSRYYMQLSDALIASDDKRLVRGIALDEVKHGKVYKDIYRVLSGEPCPEPPQTDGAAPRGTLPSVFSEKLAEKLNNTLLCRQIYLAVFDLEYRDLLFEILSDEQNHAQVLNFLYSKYSRV